MCEKIFLNISTDDQLLESNYKLKLKTLQTHFENTFQNLPDFYVRVPGRVNLIGEHIDYCGYSVCPMAIKPEIIIAVKVTKDSTIHIVNTDKQYTNLKSDINNLRITVDGQSAPFWGDYILCGIKGISETKSNGNSESNGLHMLVSGTIPPGAGLSSSSALVCAGALAYTFAFKLSFTKNELAEISARSERYIGTEGGGMDQAIIFCANKGCASHIHFNPLKMSDVHLPNNGTFVIAQSLVTKNKAASADFNTRVVECRLASLVLSKKNMTKWNAITVLANVQNELNMSYEDMIKVVERDLNQPSYSKKEVCEILNMTTDLLEQSFLTQNTKHITEFKLRQRALHVFKEAYRVQRFCNTCNETDNCLEELGAIMTESHESLKELYECSHPQLDKLAALCIKEGAYGARLTGAGWGGCVVALVNSANSQQFVSLIKSKFYQHVAPKDADVDTLIFSTEPFSGATVFNGGPILD